MGEQQATRGKYSLETHGDSISRFLQGVIDKAAFKLKFELSEGGAAHPEIEDPDLVVRFSGADVDLLLENKGELLLAMEQLTQEVLGMRSDEHALVCFDANDYRMLRIEELRLSAQTAAEKVKKTRIPFQFSPMTSRERRIIHLALRDEPAVRSESSGIGPMRGVVIYPADMPTPPAQPHFQRPPLRRGRGR